MKKSASATKKPGGISDDAVRKSTGKGAAEWFAILDAAGATKMSHKDIAAWLHENHIESGWWCQMVTVAYEQSRGLREKHEKPGGYEISVSRTIPVDISAVFRAWKDNKTRNRWLGEKGLAIRKATPDKGLRITWPDPASILVVHLVEKGRDKCQVVAQHGKLADAKAASRMKKYWAEALDRLKKMLSE